MKIRVIVCILFEGLIISLLVFGLNDHKRVYISEEMVTLYSELTLNQDVYLDDESIILQKGMKIKPSYMTSNDNVYFYIAESNNRMVLKASSFVECEELHKIYDQHTTETKKLSADITNKSILFAVCVFCVYIIIVSILSWIFRRYKNLTIIHGALSCFSLFLMLLVYMQL